MAGSGADLAITQIVAMPSTYLRYRSYQFMNIGIILLIMEPIVARHMFDLDGLW